MEKPALLRAALVAALPEYKTDPDKLAIFVDKGRLVSRLGQNGLTGFEWRYTIRIEFHDCTSGGDAIAVPLLLWLAVNQPDRLLDFQRDDTALGFAADMIDQATWDLAWSFELSEAVRVTRAPGGYQLEHLTEPSPVDQLLAGVEPDLGLTQISLAGEIVLP